MLMNAVYLIPFFIASVLNMFYVKKGIRRGILFTKPILMPCLILFYLLNTSSVNYYVLLALVFGGIGDIFLLIYKKEACTLAGILAFLIGHIFYICAFLGDFNRVRFVHVWMLLFLLPYTAAAIFLFKRLLAPMKSMKVPAAVYLIVIFFMSFISLFRIGAVSFVSFVLTYSGSLCFIFSDSLLAFNMFTGRKKNDDEAVMLTYILAQLLIVLGFLT